MTTSALPENWQELLAGYVLGDLNADEMALVQQWLVRYPEVAAALEDLEETWQTLPYGLPQQAPPPHLRQQVMASVQPVAPASRIERDSRRGPRPWMGWGLSAGWAATAVALVGVAVDNNRLRQENQSAEAIVASFSQPSNRLYALAGTDAQPQASGRLVIDPASQSALIVTQNLPSLPSDQTYRLWAIAGEQPTYCGQFNPDHDRSINQWQLPEHACETAPVQMLITRESVAAPLVPQGPLVLQGPS